MHSRLNIILNTQPFGVVGQSRGSPIFLLYCIFMAKFIEIHIWGAPPRVHLCIPLSVQQQIHFPVPVSFNSLQSDFRTLWLKANIKSGNKRKVKVGIEIFPKYINALPLPELMSLMFFLIKAFPIEMGATATMASTSISTV